MYKNKVIKQLGSAILITSLSLASYADNQCPQLKQTNFSGQHVSIKEQCRQYVRGTKHRAGYCLSHEDVYTHQYTNFTGTYDKPQPQPKAYGACKSQLHVGGGLLNVKTDYNVDQIAPVLVEIYDNKKKCFFITNLKNEKFVYVAGDGCGAYIESKALTFTKDTAFTLDCTGSNCSPTVHDSSSYFETRD